MAYPPQFPPPAPAPRRSPVRPWHLVLVGVVAVAGAALVLALVLAGSGDNAEVSADLEERWGELDRQTRIQTCADWQDNPEMVTTVFVEAFEERAAQRGADVEVQREIVEQFLTRQCG